MLIRRNGKQADVLTKQEDFDALDERERFIAAVNQGLADSEAGRVFDSEEVSRLLDEEFGPIKD
jgi:predicted transcriptional regulator